MPLSIAVSHALLYRRPTQSNFLPFLLPQWNLIDRHRRLQWGSPSQVMEVPWIPVALKENLLLGRLRHCINSWGSVGSSSQMNNVSFWPTGFGQLTSPGAWFAQEPGRSSAVRDVRLPSTWNAYMLMMWVNSNLTNPVLHGLHVCPVYLTCQKEAILTLKDGYFCRPLCPSYLPLLFRQSPLSPSLP